MHKLTHKQTRWMNYDMTVFLTSTILVFLSLPNTPNPAMLIYMHDHWLYIFRSCTGDDVHSCRWTGALICLGVALFLFLHASMCMWASKDKREQSMRRSVSRKTKMTGISKCHILFALLKRVWERDDTSVLQWFTRHVCSRPRNFSVALLFFVQTCIYTVVLLALYKVRFSVRDRIFPNCIWCIYVC